MRIWRSMISWRGWLGRRQAGAGRATAPVRSAAPPRPEPPASPLLWPSASPAELRLYERTMYERTLADTDFVIVDLETTGWTPGEARITEIGAVRFAGGRVVGEFSTLINPGQPIPPDIAELTGISDAMVASAPRIKTVLPGFLAFAGSSVLTAHNAPFDLGFLIAACSDCGLRWPGFPVLDTVILARQVLGETEVPDCKLSTLARYFGSPTSPCHRALADAKATAAVLHGLIGRLAESGVRTLAEISG
ncbi:MAG TPA: exonuclease domain-containing protein [Streptosporangiaceae bacterium]|nr:exonuclease domain-containing protein [Streptosporangiaceae bacterium]